MSSTSSLSFLLLLLLPAVADAATTECHHSVEGSCTVDDIFGFCYFNKRTGDFNCDDSGFCAKKIQGTKSAGCFRDDNGASKDEAVDCCCNKGAGCSIGFASASDTSTTTCSSIIEIPGSETQRFKDCQDPWCYTFMSAEADGGVTSVWRGCMATSIVRYKLYKAEDALYHNNSRWESLQWLIDQPKCDDILGEEMANSTVGNLLSKCVDYEWEDPDTEIVHKKRMCCCKGGAKCNEDFAWNSPSITLEMAKENEDRRKNLIVDSNGSKDSPLIFFSITSLLFLLSLRFFD